MKTTFLFFAFLIFVNCSSDLLSPNSSSYDPILAEISKDQNSEPLFATMAIQLQAKSKSAGFRRVLSLLNQLVFDSKEQLHSMTKVWRGVKTRCQVSKIKLQGRQEYFDTYFGQAQRNVATATSTLGHLGNNLEAFRKSLDSYEKMLKLEVEGHKNSRESLLSKHNKAKEGLEHLRSALSSVGNWTPKGKAFIQTHIEEVSKLYSSVDNFDLPNVAEFLERTDDNKVRKRLIEWMRVVQVHLSSGSARFGAAVSKLDSHHNATKNALGRMILSLKTGIDHINKGIHFNNELVKSGKESSSLFGQLASDNAKLLTANSKYCKAERDSFKKNEAEAKASIKLFKHLRDYFNNNYGKIHAYIKAKFFKSG